MPVKYNQIMDNIDSTTIHRGASIISSNRLALTNYFYPEHQVTQDLYEHFRPVAGVVK